MYTKDQAPQEDTLLDRDVDDVLDEGFTPPERMPASHRVGTTVGEQRDGETWDERLAQEEPEAEVQGSDEFAEVDVTGGERAGRLVAPDEGAHPDTEELLAEDVGIDGGAASAEEAAMHIAAEVPDGRLI